MVDANRGWNTVDAIDFSRLVEPYDIRWFEEPCHWYDDAAMMSQVRSATHIPVTAGQSEITSQAVRRLVDARAVDFVNYDVSEGGGVTDWRRAAALCATAGVRMAHHEEAQVAQHLLFSGPARDLRRVFRRSRARSGVAGDVDGAPEVKDGWIEVPKAPGFGIELDEAMVRRFRVT